MQKIPTVLMEEHRDAYYHWHRFIDMGAIPPSGNYLLHIDHHDDMECPGYDWDLTSMPQNAQEALDFTDRCLGIADFIVPAVWEGTFDTIHILKELVPAPVRSTSTDLRLMQGSRGCLKITDRSKAGQDRDWHAGAPWLIPERKNAGERSLTCQVKYGGLNDTDRFPGSGVVLDVDLDYFCWDNSTSFGEPRRIEITEDAYQSFVNDRDHPLRILPSRIIDVTRDEGKYWLYLSQTYPQDPVPDDTVILRRIQRLFYYLRYTGIRPLAIDICRSVRSGYLPAQKAAFVQDNFTRILEEYFPLLYI